MIDVIIADHQELFQVGMAEVLAVADDVRIVGQPQSPEQLLSTLRTSHLTYLISVDELSARVFEDRARC